MKLPVGKLFFQREYSKMESGCDCMLRVDSRKVKEGDTFLALRGVDSDGHKFIPSAIQNGAKKIIAEEGSYSVETEIVEDTRKYLSDYLKEKYKETRNQIKLIGVTGTNGKTTTAFLLHKAFCALHVRASYIGTVGFYQDEKIRSLNNTTPDLYDLYEMMDESVQKGCKVMVMEVSSQGLAYGRVNGLEFDMALFTNLTQDHLDFHKTMENYALAKQELFRRIKKDGCAVVNVDDSYKGYYLLEENRNVTYGFLDADYKITHFHMNPLGTSFDFSYQGNTYPVETKLLGKYNVYNMMSVITLLHEYGFSMDEILSISSKLEAPAGRMDTVRMGTNSIIVDYAHTPDAIENILKTVKEVKPHHIYVVFGCTGDRDRLKRPIMTRLVLENVDYGIISNDDPHFEDPNRIVEDMTKGLECTNYEVILDRKKAIEKGISLLKEYDMLLILGKGHEEVMIVRDKKIPMNDKNIVLDFLKQCQR